jgi:hypothetical protein
VGGRSLLLLGEGVPVWDRAVLGALREADGPGGLLVVLVVEGGRASDFLVDGADTTGLLANRLRLRLQGRESITSASGLILLLVLVLPILGLVVLTTGRLREVVRCLACHGRHHHRSLRVVGRLSGGHGRTSRRSDNSLRRHLRNADLTLAIRFRRVHRAVGFRDARNGITSPVAFAVKSPHLRSGLAWRRQGWLLSIHRRRRSGAVILRRWAVLSNRTSNQTVSPRVGLR